MGEFEKDIRDIFVDLEVAIDTDELWQGIEKKLDKKKRKYPIWWIIIPLLLLPIVTYSIYINNIKINQTKKEIVATNDLKTDNKHKVIKTEDGNLENITNEKTEEQDITKLNNQKSDIDSRVVNIENKILNSKILSKTPAKSSIILNVEDSDQKSNVVNSHKSITSTPITNVSRLLHLVYDIKNESILNDTKKSRMLFSFYKLKAPFGLLVTQNKFTLKNDTFEPVVNNKTNSKRTKLNLWEKSIDIGIGFALVSKALHAKNNNSLEYEKKRKETESYLEAINANININIKNRNGIFFSTGINYTQIDEKFSSRSSIEETSAKEDIAKEITGLDGTVTRESGTIDVLKQINWDKIIYNYYHFIDIPFSIGYSYGANNNWNLELSSGVSYNLVFAKKGQIIGLDGYPVDINKNKGLFKNNSGLSLISNFKAIYNYKNHLFYFEPNIKYGLNSITKESNPIEQKYFTYGLKIGTRFSF